MTQNNIDNLYYNLTIRNDSDKYVDANFSENRVNAILNNPTDYEMTVVRFNIPSDSLSIFTFIDGNYIVTLEDVQTLAQYITPVIFQPTSANPNNKDIFSYNAFVTMINTALNTSFQALIAANPANPGTRPPFISYNPNTKLFELYTENVFSNKLFMNDSLYGYFTGFSSFDYNVEPDHYHLLITDDRELNTVNIGGVDYKKSTAEFSTLQAWSDLARLELQSNIPINSELIGGQKDITSRLLMDFLPNVLISNGENFVYDPFQFRWVDMISNYPLTRIDMDLVFRYKDGSTSPLELSPSSVASIKILFRKKLRPLPYLGDLQIK